MSRTKSRPARPKRGARAKDSRAPKGVARAAARGGAPAAVPQAESAMPRLDLKGDPRSRRKIGKAFEGLVALQARLRAPNGCPWDREQTHDSLRTYLVEETYEVLDAMGGGDAHKFADELGDLLLQIVFHAQLAAETGKFDIADVIELIYTKMVRRHPHVFGTVRAETSAEVLKNWEQLKAEERALGAATAKGAKRSNGDGKAAAAPAADKASASILDAVPRSLPALLEAHQLTRRAANVGFDWPNVEGIFAKLGEETAELKEELKQARAVGGGGRPSEKAAGQIEPRETEQRKIEQKKIEEEVGDLLFTAVNLARFLKLDAEIALKSANRKFAQRFREMERIAAGRGQTLAALSAGELDALWNEVKRANGAGKQRA